MNNGSGRTPCDCPEAHEQAKLIVVTGGPGGGKTAALELARRSFCRHVAILPEAAGILFSGGFWRHETRAGRESAQRAIYHIQREQERMALEEKRSAVILCDRGTLDSLAYWPGSQEAYFSELRTTLEVEIARYAVVIHLRTPSRTQGYNNLNPVRVESAYEAAEIDEKMLSIWKKHPHRYLVESEDDFFDKAKKVLECLRKEVPTCCIHSPLHPATDIS